MKHLSVDVRVPIEQDNPAILRLDSLCIKCGACRDVCRDQISVGHHYDLLKTKDTAICIHCGQCAAHCPTNAIMIRQDYMKVKDDMHNGKITVFITSPSVRVAIGEAFGMDDGGYEEGKMVAALHALGADYIFDTTFAADLTIMEEASELIDRITNHKPLPQFTSCCPAWVKFVETYYPHLLPHLSSSKSPISMFAPTIKTWFAKKEGLDPENISVVAITPCTAKKFEIQREEARDASAYHGKNEYQDCDHVITTSELATWLRAENIDFGNLEDRDYDTLMPRGSGAGIIFGNTGGVMEAALRSSYYFLTKEQPKDDFLTFEALRGLDGVKEATVTIQDLTLRVAIVHGTDNARAFLDHMNHSEEPYHFVEVMTCRGGCIGGGGQIVHPGKNMDEVKAKRIASLYQKDASITLRNSHDNPHIKEVYQEFYGAPLSTLAKSLLHTSYHARHDLMEDPSTYEQAYVKETPKQQVNTPSSIQYVCTICGFIYEGDITQEPAEYHCPICTVGKDLFEKVEQPKEDSHMTTYKCSICGYCYEGDITKESDDYRCPICNVPKDLFEEEVQKETEPTSISYKCSICGYVYEGDINQEPDSYTCPLCGVPKHLFEVVEK